MNNSDKAVRLNERLGKYEKYLTKNVDGYIPYLSSPQPWHPYYKEAKELSDELSGILAQDAFDNI